MGCFKLFYRPTTRKKAKDLLSKLRAKCPTPHRGNNKEFTQIRTSPRINIDCCQPNRMAGIAKKEPLDAAFDLSIESIKTHAIRMFVSDG